MQERNSGQWPDEILDLLVVGAGPAGISCAIQAWRDGLKLVVVSDEPPGGLLPAARRLDNLPSQAAVSGQDLANKMAAQIESLKVNLIHDKILSCTFDETKRIFSIHSKSGKNLYSRTICMATGTRPRKWDLPVENGKLHRDIRKLPRELSWSKVLVVGGGEAALDTALSASDRGAQVWLLVRGSKLRASAGLIVEVEQSDIHVNFGTELHSADFSGNQWTVETGATVLSGHELVVCIGREPRFELLEGLLPGKPDLSILQSKQPGLFLAGDVIRGRDRYTATAIGDGQRAAVLAKKYIEEVTSS